MCWSSSYKLGSAKGRLPLRTYLQGALNLVGEPGLEAPPGETAGEGISVERDEVEAREGSLREAFVPSLEKEVWGQRREKGPQEWVTV